MGSTKSNRAHGDAAMRRTFFKDDLGVNVIIEYLMNFTILIILFTVILSTDQSLINRSNSNIAYSEYSVYANDIANRIVVFDRMVSSSTAQGGSVNDLNATFMTQGKIAGQSYVIKISGNGEKNVGIYSSDGQTLLVKAGFNTTIPVDTKTLESSNDFHTITYKNNMIEVT